MADYELLEQEHGEWKMKSKEQLTADGFGFQWFSYVESRQRYKVDKWTFGTEQHRTEFETELCANDGRLVAKMYKPVLRFETEEEQIKKCMIKWTKNFDYVQMNQWYT